MAKPILHRIYDDLYARKRLEVFLRSTYLDMESPSFEAKALLGNSERMLTYLRGGFPAEEIRKAARHTFILEFYRYTGLTLERSLGLALFLLGQFEMLSRQLVGVNSPPDAHSRASIPWRILLGSLGSPADQRAPQREWFSRLLHSVEGNPVVEEVIDSIYNLATCSPDGETVVTHSQPEMTQQHSAEQLEKLVDAEYHDSEVLQCNTPIFLTSEEEAIFARLRQSGRAEFERNFEQGRAALSWFSAHDEFRGELEWKRREIVERQHGSRPGIRFLRDNGVDHFEVDVQPLWHIGVRSVAFHPEGRVFHDPALRIAIRKETPHLIVFPACLENLRLELVDVHMLYNLQYDDLDQLRRFLEFVIINMMHRIMVQRVELRSRVVNGVVVPRPTEVRRFEVASHTRGLPSGSQASEEAKALAFTEKGIILNSGETYVSAYPKGGKDGSELVYDWPIEPWAVYTEDDLYEDGGG